MNREEEKLWMQVYLSVFRVALSGNKDATEEATRAADRAVRDFRDARMKHKYE